MYFNKKSSSETTARHSLRSVCLAIFAYAILAVLVLGANPFVGETSAPMGLLKLYPGWSSHEFTSPPSHIERSDILDAFIPQWITLKEAIRANESALWNPVASNGRPGILDLSRAVFTPSFLAFILVDDHWLGFYLANLIKLIIAATGVFLFLRLYLNPFAAFFGGVVFAYSGFNAAWFYWPQVFTSAWIPWLLWACSGWYLFREIKWIFLISFSTIMLVLGGFPAVAAYGLYASILLAAVLSFENRNDIKNAAWSAGMMLTSIAAAFLIAAIPILALSEVLGFTNLEYRTGGTPFDFPKDLALFANSYLYGLPRVERTFYMGMVALALSLASFFLLFRKRLSKKILLVSIFGVSLLLLSIVIAFGLLPHDVIRLLPAIGGSPWGRFVVMTGLAVSILAAVALDYLIARTKLIRNAALKAGAVTVMLTGVGYQIYDQASLFRVFNNTSGHLDFFPATPATNYVKANLKGSQSVVADNSYMVSGTLGAYGIPEWFAHDFKTDNEKHILNQIVTNPFRTPTAAVVSAKNIVFESGLLSKLGIRYVLVKNEGGKAIRKQPHGEHIAAPPLPKNALSQTIHVEEPISVSAVSIVLATYGAKTAPSDVYLELAGAKGEPLGKAVLAAESIQDNKNALFRFGQDIDLVRGTYELRLGMVDSNVDGRLTAWYTRNPKHHGDSISINGIKTAGAMLYVLYAENLLLRNQDTWQVHDQIEKKILIVENMHTPASAYFVSDLEPGSQWTETEVITKRHHAEKITIKYSGNDAGYLVLPIRWFPGWVAYQNNVKKIPVKYLGMLLAVDVDGPSEIEFAYEPTYLIKGAWLMVGGLAGLLFLARFASNQKRLKPIVAEK